MITVGELLRSQREKKKLTLDDIHKFIKIHPKFLLALEEGNYSVFSDKVHAKGFLKNYAEFLDLNVDEVLAFWRREYGGEFDKKTTSKGAEFDLKPLHSTKLAFTPGVIFAFLSIILVLGFFGYLFFQYSTYSGAPNLEVYTPENNAVVSSDLVDITGLAERDSVLSINNQRVVLNTDGSFATTLKLNEGLNTLNIRVVNNLGRETEKVLTVIYRPNLLEVTEVKESTESSSAVEL
ncbi:MAG: helix-turn-helix domain-containing protein [Patescibacteria group bacterium]